MRGMSLFGYGSITVLYAWELTSVSMCFSQGDGFNTSLSRLPTVRTSYCLDFLDLLSYLLALCTECLGLCIVLGVVVGGTVMCYPGRR